MSPVFLAFVTSISAASFDVSTVAERSGFTATGRLSEMSVLCERLKGVGQGCELMGTSPEGRPLLAFVLSSVPAAERATSAAFQKRPRVLVIGGIHAGEIDGKDASVTVIEELLNALPGQPLAGVLDAVTVVVVPVYNVDGHERFGTNNRPNQRGPTEMGWRVTSSNLNLNRDWTKADATETRLMLGLMQRHDPVVVVDLHVTDGAKFRHDIAVMVEPWHDDGTDTPLIAPTQALSTTLQAHLTKTGHRPLDFYPSFEVDDDPASGFARGVVPGRLTHGYVARRGRIGVLVETHSWVPYKQRVQATVDTLVGFLALAKTEAPRWRTAADDSDRLRQALPGKTVDVAFASDPTTISTIDFLGYAYTRTSSDVSGALWTVYDEGTPAVWQVPLVQGVKATSSVTAPVAYAVLPGFAAAVRERLQVHGIASTTVTAPLAVSEVECFVATTVTMGARSYEGRQTATVQGAWSSSTPKTTTTLPVGTLIVPVGQARGRLVVELMEPGARESLVGWGFFNARFEQKEYMEPYVAEEVARTMLKDSAVKAAFDARLQSDEAFRKDPEARLDFFYRRHPSFDAVSNVLPVYRLSSLPTITPSR